MKNIFAWATRDVIGWISKSIILPLAPFLIGALIRGLIRRVFNETIFDPSELSFSMGMLCLLVSLSANTLNDKSLASSLASNFSVGIFVFASLFTLAIVFEELTSTPDGKAFADIVNSIRWITLIVSSFTIIVAILSKHKFKLESFDL